MAGCLITDFGEACGAAGSLYEIGCVHEHVTPPGEPMEICDAHAAIPWICLPCEEIDGHRCPQFWQRVT